MSQENVEVVRRDTSFAAWIALAEIWHPEIDYEGLMGAGTSEDSISHAVLRLGCRAVLDFGSTRKRLGTPPTVVAVDDSRAAARGKRIRTSDETSLA